MPELDWSVFLSLPGSVDKNWELLCRELIRRNYGRFGRLQSVLQQPGVEFHLDLLSDCQLGDSTQHWGWQCRWYQLEAGRPIGAGRRAKIERAIQKTQQYVPSITDWVLWTRRKMTPADQQWYFELDAPFTLHHWAEEEVLGLLSGSSELLRATYFGELVLTHETFEQMHEVAIAPIRRRWEPALHIEVEVESELRAALGAPGAWPEVSKTAVRLAQHAKELVSDIASLRAPEIDLINQTAGTLERQSRHLSELAAVLDGGSISNARDCVSEAVTPAFPLTSVAKLAATLRSIKHPASIVVSEAVSQIKAYITLLRRLSSTLEENFFAVIGDAGFGKTFLAVQLTQPADERSGGILIQAKNLRAGGTLDELASRVPFGGDGMAQLLEAVDAAGARLDRRIPILIDGLNESQNPRDWKDLLEILKTLIDRTANCAVVVTLRSAIADEILPAKISRKYLTGFEFETDEAVRKYFEFYKIDPTDALLPWSQFASPLFLSLFCQATNPDREAMVGIDRIPRSLTAVFEAYRVEVVSRAALILNIAHQDVESALERVAFALWNENARGLDFDRLRELVGDTPRDWVGSLARVLEEEGVLSREPGPRFRGFFPEANGENQVSAILYDAFAGFMIADAIIAQQGQSGFSQWIENNWKRLSKSDQGRHPLAEDVFGSIAGLLPRRLHIQLWTVVPQELKELALLETAHLEPERIDDATCTQLVSLCRTPPFVGAPDPFVRLWSTRGAVQHPLNAEFLQTVLSDMEVSARDLRWSEWLRRNRENIVRNLEQLERLWSENQGRNERDKLIARWIMWTLTSSVRNVRDQATKSLYWYGLGAPQPFFDLVLESCRTNDPYVPERMLAAAYGVVMGYQTRPVDISKQLSFLLHELAAMMTGANASAPTNYWMARVYVQGIVDFARIHCPVAVPDGMVSAEGIVAYTPAEYLSSELVAESYPGYIGHDFENYEVGRLFDDRQNYDNKHSAFAAAIKEIRGRIWRLGYRVDAFETIDSDIGSEFRRRQEPGKTERYAKKYAWIGYYEKAGMLCASGERCHKPRSGNGNPIVDIDPSFPEVPASLSIEVPDWLAGNELDNREWLRAGKVQIPNELLRTNNIDGLAGPWIAVKGFIEQTNKVRGRQVFGFVRGLLVPPEEVANLISLMESKDYLGNSFIPSEPSDHYTYAGEIPWSDEFATTDEYDGECELYQGRIGGYWGTGPVVEILSHHFAWEDYHSQMNRAGGCSVASKEFSRQFDLRACPSSFDQIDSEGRFAVVTRSPPQQCDRDGGVVYIREDLLQKYLEFTNTELIMIAWGERQLTNLGYQHPEWAHEIYGGYLHVWRHVVKLSDLQTQNRG